MLIEKKPETSFSHYKERNLKNALCIKIDENLIMSKFSWSRRTPFQERVIYQHNF